MGHRYTQWFYFGVRGGTASARVTFKIINMHKAGLLFGEQGMRPVGWSCKVAAPDRARACACWDGGMRGAWGDMVSGVRTQVDA